MQDEKHSGSTEAQQNFLELLSKFHTATVITHGSAGALHGRPMSVAKVENDGTLWFLTDAASAKVAEIVDNRRALVTFAESDKYVVMSGEVELVRDPEQAEALWKEPFRLWFSGPADPALTLIRFQPEEGEYWNNAGAQGLKSAFRAAKAYVKGEKLQDSHDPAVHGKVRREA